MTMMMVIFDQQVTMRPDLSAAVSAALGKIGRKCDVMSGVWSIITNKSAAEVRDDLLASGIGTKEKFLVAPLGAPWEGQNCMSTYKCYG